MGNRTKIWLTAVWACAVAVAAFGYERAPAEVVRALGTARGKSVSSGLVFIDGKFIKAPYRVTRAGNQILINERPVTGQLVPWEKFLETQPPSKLKVTEVEAPEEAPAPAPAAKPAPAEDGVDPAAPKDGGVPQKKDGKAEPSLDDLFSGLSVTIVERRLAADADDLDDFKPNTAPDKMKLTDIPADTEADKARQKRAEDEKKAEEEDDDEEEEAPKEQPSAGETEEAIDPASPEGEAAAKAAAAKQAAAKAAKPAVKMRKVTALDGAFDLNFRAQKLLKPIDNYRAMLERTLRRGGYLFIGTGGKRYLKGRTSDAATTRELLKKLPELMREADSAEGFYDKVRSEGLVGYIDLQISQDLYRNRTGFAALLQRRRELADEDKLKQMINGHGR